MLYTIKLELLTNESQFKQLTFMMEKFNEVCCFINSIGESTKTLNSKVALQREVYHKVREKFNIPSQLVVRAVGEVVEANKSYSRESTVTFPRNSRVVLDNRLITIKWLNIVSMKVPGQENRIDVPFMVREYHLGTYEKRVPGLADLIIKDNKYFLQVVVDLPNNDTEDKIKKIGE